MRDNFGPPLGTLAADQFHRDEVRRAGTGHLVDGHDVGVAEPGRCPGLADETLQHVGIAAYSDEAHVEENRRLYRIKFDLADQILGNRYGYRRPAGGFCVWLDVSDRGGDEAATVKLYRDGGVRVVPGSYLARQQADGSNPGAGYIRLALVQDGETTAEALHRLVEILD